MPSVSLSSVLNQPLPQQQTQTIEKPVAAPSLLSVLGIGGPAPAVTPSTTSSSGGTHAAKPVVLTAAGAEHVRQSMAKEGHDPANTWLRLGVKGGGCSGLGYVLDFTHKVDATDVVFESQGIKIAVDKKSLIYLGGTQVDWVSGLKGHGWKFENPNEKRGCGCGQSFTV